MLDRPYFMTNRHWYTFDFEKHIYVLTPAAPEEAKESYEQYLKDTEQMKQNMIGTESENPNK